MESKYAGRYHSLLNEIRKTPSLLIAFSGGVDSSLLAFAAVEALGRDKVLAVTALARTYPGRERAEAESFCRAHGVSQRFIETDEVAGINAHGNPFDRCYYCKLELFTRLRDLARSEGLAAVAEGS
ncbi:MAG: TIGR00268 family protein, partial [Spirochaetales bacterium]|nr:TIGR00268 family protein [Spirochaetales bacterium]